MSLLTPIFIVIAIWWLGTGLVLYLQQRIARVRAPLALALLAITLLSLVALNISGGSVDSGHSYLGFVAAIVLWGCIELSYYTGIIGGVHARRCPDNCTTGKRFRLALGTSIWHELSVLFAGGVVTAMLYNAANPVALYCFVVLWLMRWSAKLNLFFGVPNFNTDWFPKRLAYAHSYIRRAPVTLFFPLSLFLACLVTVELMSRALARPYEMALIMILPAALLSLAILEHIFMALPIADSELWNRIFARELDRNSDSDEIAQTEIETVSAHRIKARTQERILQSMSVSTKGSVSVTLDQVEATATHSVSQ